MGNDHRLAGFGVRISWSARVAAFAVLAISSSMGAAQVQSQAQSTSSNTPVLAYDVAAIKLDNSGSGDVGYKNPPDGLVLTNIPLVQVIRLAYQVQDPQLLGVPDWIRAERYDIDAKMDEAVAAAFNKLDAEGRRLARLQMLQALLADRFKLVVHRDSRDVSVFMLVAGKNGPKLKETPAVSPAPGAPAVMPTGGPSIRNSRNGTGPITLTVYRCKGESLANMLSPYAGRPVVDKTGLASKYDFILRFLPDDAPASESASDPTATSLFTAVQDQLGLKLEAGRGPVEHIVIDHIERPSGN
jgi:uncharacterized protein (TIGR03435 family)